MSARLEELDFQPTPIGEVSLRRRTDPSSGVDVYEVKLGEEYLMSSLFTVAEIELSRLALARLTAPAWPSPSAGWGSATPRRRCWRTPGWPPSSSSTHSPR